MTLVKFIMGWIMVIAAPYMVGRASYVAFGFSIDNIGEHVMVWGFGMVVSMLIVLISGAILAIIEEI